jgi:hypothetical protein
VPFVRGSLTSRAAAQAIESNRLSLREQVYRYISMFGPVTDEEITEALMMNPSTERPRRVELVGAGRIRQNGTRPTRSGRSAAAWERCSNPVK